MSFGSLGCRRARDTSIPSFLASMNSVGELVETIFSRANIAGTNKFAEAVEFWRGASGSRSHAPIVPCSSDTQQSFLSTLLARTNKK